MVYPLKKIMLTILLTLSIYIPIASYLEVKYMINGNMFLIASLVFFFYMYYKTTTIDIFKALCVFMTATVSMAFASSLSCIVDAIYNPTSGYDIFSLEGFATQYVIAIIETVLLIWPLGQKMNYLLRKLNSRKIWLTILGFPIISLMLAIFTTPKHYHTLYTGKVFLSFIIVTIANILITVYAYVFSYNIAKTLLSRAELEEKNRFLEMQSSSYKRLQDYMEQTKKLRHDFKHSVHAMSTMAKNEEYDSLKDYINNYEKELSTYTTIIFCKNSALNAVFQYYYQLAKDKNIEVNWSLDFPDPLNFLEIDLCSLLGNIMENAIAGCETVPESERFFSISVEVANTNYLYIVSTNSFDGKIRKKGNKFLTTKRSGNGIGISSMESIAQKYEGNLKIFTDKNEFNVDVILKTKL